LGSRSGLDLPTVVQSIEESGQERLMSWLKLDRLLETSLRREADVLLVAGTSGYICAGTGLRAFQMPIITSEELALFAAECLVEQYGPHEGDGFRYATMTYNGKGYRLNVFGGEEPSNGGHRR